MYDLLILGGGTAGMNAAVRASRSGYKVALFEKQSQGGGSMSGGGISANALLYSANAFYIAGNSRYGHTVMQSGYDMGAAVARKNSIVRKILLESRQSVDNMNIRFVNTHGQISAYGGGEITVSAAGKTYTGTKLLLAAGAVHVTPDIPGADEALVSGYAVTPDYVGRSAFVPKVMCIIGANALSLEIAQIYEAAGCSVTILAPGEEGCFLPDRDYSLYFENEVCKGGIDIVYNAVPLSVEGQSLLYSSEGVESAISSQLLMFCEGRRANLRGYGLEMLKLRIDGAGIFTDAQMRTSADNVWAAGDCTGRHMLAHVAERESEIAVNNMFGLPSEMSYANIPFVCYTKPSVASVGITLEDALRRGMEAWMVELPLHCAGRFQIENIRGPGLVKLVLNDDKVVGFHMVGDGAPEMCAAALVMIESGTPLKLLRGLMFAHLTMGELFRMLISEAYYRFENTMA